MVLKTEFCHCDRTAKKAQITFDQYEAYTPEKLELWDDFYDYGYPDDFKGFYLAILTNMGLRAAVSHIPISQ